MQPLNLCAGNFLSDPQRRRIFASGKVLKSNFSRRYESEFALELAGSELEKIVARSLRQVPPAHAPVLAWPVVCGSAVAERTRALDFIDGVLRVAVSDAGWKKELQALAPRYLASVNRYTAEPVRKVEFIIMRPETAENTR